LNPKNILKTQGLPKKYVSRNNFSNFLDDIYDEFSDSLEYDYGKHPQICQYLQNKVDEIQMTYSKWGNFKE